MDWHWAQRERVKVTHHNKDLLFFLSFTFLFFSHLRSHCLQPISFNFNLPWFVSCTLSCVCLPNTLPLICIYMSFVTVVHLLSSAIFSLNLSLCLPHFCSFILPSMSNSFLPTSLIHFSFFFPLSSFFLLLWHDFFSLTKSFPINKLIYFLISSLPSFQSSMYRIKHYRHFIYRYFFFPSYLSYTYNIQLKLALDSKLIHSTLPRSHFPCPAVLCHAPPSASGSLHYETTINENAPELTNQTEIFEISDWVERWPPLRN